MALKSLVYCHNCIERMIESKTLDAYEEHWKSFLVNLIAVRNKVKNMEALSALPQSTVSQVGAFFNSDLGTYLIHARNCDAHTIRPITAKSGGFVSISGKNRGAEMFQGSISIEGNAITLETVGNIEVSFTPSKIKLIDVVDNKVTFTVPTSTPDGLPIESI